MGGFKSILVVVEDEGAASRESLRRAAALAHLEGADITVAQVIEPLPAHLANHVPRTSRTDLQERMVAARFHRLAVWSRDLLGDRVERVTSAVLVGTPFLEIIHRIDQEGHDLVVLVGEPPASTRRLGATALHLLRKSPVPVWLLRARRRGSVARIGAALASPDGDPVRIALNDEILAAATSFAQPRGAEVIAVHAWHVVDEELVRKTAGLSRADADALVQAVRSDAQRWLRDTVRAASTGSVRLRAGLVKGRPGQQLPRFARRHRLDLMVMGTVGHVDVPGLIMGEDAEDIAQNVRCEILAIKPPGFVSPVLATA